VWGLEQFPFQWAMAKWSIAKKRRPAPLGKQQQQQQQQQQQPQQLISISNSDDELA